MDFDKKEKALKRAKAYQTAKRIGIVALFVWVLFAYLKGNFLVTGIPAICFLCGLILLSEQGFRKAMQIANAEIEYSFLVRKDSVKTTEGFEEKKTATQSEKTFAGEANRDKGPSVINLTNMALITFSVFVIGCLIIGSMAIVGIIMDIYFTDFELPMGTFIFFFLIGMASLFGYVVLASNMVYAIRKERRTKMGKAVYVSVLLILSAVVLFLSIIGFMNHITYSWYELTFEKVFWFSLGAVAFTAPIIVLLASIKNRRLKSAQKKPLIERYYQSYMLSMKRRDPRVEIPDSLKGFLNRTGTTNTVGNPHMQPRQAGSTQKVSRALDEDIGLNLSVREQGRMFAREINKANDLIPDERITTDLNIICNYVNDIYTQASKSKSIEQEIRKFNNIYLPKTLQLCNIYINLQKRSVETERVKELKAQIGDSLGNAKRAFAKFNDNLTQQSSLDIEAEIETFERILTIDGLLNAQELEIAEEEKEATGS